MFKVKWTGDVCSLLSELVQINEELTIQIKKNRAMISLNDFYVCAFIGDEIEIPEGLLLIKKEEIEIREVKKQPSHQELIKMYEEWGYKYTG